MMKTIWKILVVLLATGTFATSALAAPRAVALTKTTYSTPQAAARGGASRALSRAFRTPFHASDLNIDGRGHTKAHGATRYRLDDGNNFNASINVYRARAGYKADKNSARTWFNGIE